METLSGAEQVTRPIDRVLALARAGGTNGIMTAKVIAVEAASREVRADIFWLLKCFGKTRCRLRLVQCSGMMLAGEFS